MGIIWRWLKRKSTSSGWRKPDSRSSMSPSFLAMTRRSLPPPPSGQVGKSYPRGGRLCPEVQGRGRCYVRMQGLRSSERYRVDRSKIHEHQGRIHPPSAGGLSSTAGSGPGASAATASPPSLAMQEDKAIIEGLSVRISALEAENNALRARVAELERMPTPVRGMPPPRLSSTRVSLPLLSPIGGVVGGPGSPDMRRISSMLEGLIDAKMGALRQELGPPRGSIPPSSPPQLSEGGGGGGRRERRRRGLKRRGSNHSPLRSRRAQTGGLLLEIPGAGKADKAEMLAAKLAGALTDFAVKVSCPQKRADLRVSGLDESVTPMEVAETLAAAGGCRVQYPATAARKVAVAGHLRVGWSDVRVVALPARPQQCYRCLETGHVRQRCTADVDRGDHSYKCGTLGHRAGQCSAAALHCIVCADMGRPANHRLGGPLCKPPTRRARQVAAKVPTTTKEVTVVETNVNHARRAHDLLVGALATDVADIAVVAEPYAVPDCPSWFGNNSGSVAIAQPDGSRPGFLLVGVYAPPRWPFATFEEFLDGLQTFVSQHAARPVLVLGDFNAHAIAWRSPRTAARGSAYVRAVPGCKCRGPFMGFPWCRTPGYGVARGRAEETLSDHWYIRIEVSVTTPNRPYPHQQRQQRRWAIKALDEDALMAAVLAVAWSEPSTGPVVDVEAEAEWFHEAMVAVCDTAMPRARPPPRRPVYWWSAAIAELRDNCAAARRQYARSRRRRHRDEARTALLYAEYRHLTVQLQQAIRRAKADAWDGLLRSLDRDPWGRQYKFAVSKLRSWAPPITETMDSQPLGRVVGTLFPSGDEPATFPRQVDQCDWSTELEVSEEELAGAVQCLRDRNTAPGPDGIPGRALAMAFSVLGPRLRRLFTAVLRTGTFLPRWRFGRLVHLKKEGRDAESPSAYRPIVLLDEVGKLYERIVASRLSRHLSRDGPDLAECQFGFRGGRSTVDAPLRARPLPGEG
ncbi:uncharacterized protein LOC143432457 [Xylocopa sonorina]|uniref:uncharacterized protein LOC143432457 n=1 Tax=Xylocopa sonorina TaxID=1818115 RepID=UPI00403B0311